MVSTFVRIVSHHEVHVDAIEHYNLIIALSDNRSDGLRWRGRVIGGRRRVASRHVSGLRLLDHHHARLLHGMHHAHAVLLVDKL